MVKIYILRHAESELNQLKKETLRKFELTEQEKGLCLLYKFLNREYLLDAPITTLGEAQCMISKLENEHKLKKVKLFGCCLIYRSNMSYVPH